MLFRVEPGYESLADAMQEALDQAQLGKGQERHANERPFEDQTLMNNTRAVGTGYPCGQAMKKAEELHSMVQRGEYAQAIEEAHGAAVYLLTAALWIEECAEEEQEEQEEKSFRKCSNCGDLTDHYPFPNGKILCGKCRRMLGNWAEIRRRKL